MNTFVISGVLLCLMGGDGPGEPDCVGMESLVARGSQVCHVSRSFRVYRGRSNVANVLERLSELQDASSGNDQVRVDGRKSMPISRQGVEAKDAQQAQMSNELGCQYERLGFRNRLSSRRNQRSDRLPTSSAQYVYRLAT